MLYSVAVKHAFQTSKTDSHEPEPVTDFRKLLYAFGPAAMFVASQASREQSSAGLEFFACQPSIHVAAFWES